MHMPPIQGTSTWYSGQFVSHYTVPGTQRQRGREGLLTRVPGSSRPSLVGTVALLSLRYCLEDIPGTYSSRIDSMINTRQVLVY